MIMAREKILSTMSLGKHFLPGKHEKKPLGKILFQEGAIKA